jgi:MoaA/NifB/PqqE/SkfB family radical SAM enzyme
MACSFCGMQAIRDNGANGPLGIRGTNSKPFMEMTTMTAERISLQIRQAGWNPRIEFAMHGEPTMNTNLIDIIRIFRKNLPKVSMMMTSNGGGFLFPPSVTTNINNLMEAGLNILLLDDYDATTIVKKIIKKYKGPHGVMFYPQQAEANPHRRRKPSEHLVVICQDVSGTPGGTHGRLNNHGRGSFPGNNSLEGKRCARVFREISVRWDGRVAICCMDFRGVYKCGDVWETPIDEIWQNKYFRAARKMLYQGLRTFGPCDGCDSPSYRAGLLPDKLGKKSLPKPTEKTFKILTKAMKGDPYTEPVLRPWENETNWKGGYGTYE